MPNVKSCLLIVSLCLVPTLDVHAQRATSATLENPIQGHVTLNAVIEPSPEGAIGKSYLVYPGERGIIAEDAEHRGHVGGYQDVYVKTPQGWRFKKRIHIFPPNVPGMYVFPAD